MKLNKETTSCSSLWAELRKFLTHRHVQLCIHQRYCAVYTVAKICIDGEDNLNTIELASWIVNGSIHCQGTNVLNASYAQGFVSDINSIRESDQKERTARNIAMKIKDRQQKLSGDLAECWQDYYD